VAIILPATTGYHVRQAQDVSAGAPSYAEHWRDAIENQHWLLAHTARTAHWSDTREIPISNAKYGAGWNEVFRYAFKTGIGKAATIRPNYQLCATANVAAGCNFRIALYSAAGAALGAVDTALAIAAAQWYGPSDWSDTHGALEPVPFRGIPGENDPSRSGSAHGLDRDLAEQLLLNRLAHDLRHCGEAP